MTTIEILKNIAIHKWQSLEIARFSQSGNEVSFRCPICGDSKKDETKVRFSFNTEKNLFYCFNCEAKGTVQTLAKLCDYAIDMHIYASSSSSQAQTPNSKKVFSCDALIKKVAMGDLWMLWHNRKKIDDPAIHEQMKLAIKHIVKERKIRLSQQHEGLFVLPWPDSYLRGYLLLMCYRPEGAESMPYYVARKIDNNLEGPKYRNIKEFAYSENAAFIESVIDYSKVAPPPLNPKRVYVAESWFSALALRECGVNAVCVFGLKNMKADHPTFKKYQDRGFEFVFMPDNDESIDQFLKPWRWNKDRDLSYKVAMPHPYHKDFGDFYAWADDTRRARIKELLDNLKIFDLAKWQDFQRFDKSMKKCKAHRETLNRSRACL